MTPRLSLVTTSSAQAVEPRGQLLFLNRSEAGRAAATKRIQVLIAARHALVRTRV